MTTLLFSEDSITATRRLWHTGADGGVVVETQTDVEPVIVDAKDRYNEFRENAGWKGDFHHVASIPMGIFLKLWEDGTARDPKAIKKWINDRDNRVFKVRPGKV